MKSWLLLIVFGVLGFAREGFSVSKTAAAEQISSETRIAMKAISERYKKLKNWTAEFSQESFSIGLGRGTFQTGTFRFADPNLIDFVVKEPEASQFVSDGQQAWHVKYPKGLSKAADAHYYSQVSGMELSRYLIFLKGIDVADAAKEKELLAEYKVSGKSDPASIVLTLEPRKSSEISSVELHFSQNKIPPSKIVLLDAIGNTTTVTILKTTLDAKLEKASFRPQLPKGSKVVEK